MRKILLATAAFALFGAGQALAAGSDSVTVSTTVAQACTVSITGTAVALPADGSPSAAEAFSFQCNFGGNTAQLTYTSLFGGVDDDGAGPNPPNVYNIVPSVGASGGSNVPFSSGGLVTAANTAVPASFQLDLVNPIIVAGTYTDTLTISIAP